MRVKINSTGEIKEVKQVGDKLFDKENNWYLLSNVILLDNWRPVSEFPPEEGEYIVKKEWGLARADLSHSRFENGKWSTPQVKWWCYPPEED